METNKKPIHTSSFKLDDAHLVAAMRIVNTHRTKQKCSHCYDRGWIGLNEKNQLVVCYKCVDTKACMKDWKEYVIKANQPDLNEEYKELVDETSGVQRTVSHANNNEMPGADGRDNISPTSNREPRTSNFPNKETT